MCTREDGKLNLSQSLIRESSEIQRRMSSPIHEPSAIYGAVLDEKTPKRSAFRFNLAIALLIWAMWLAFGGRIAIYHLLADWQVALTMVFGSLVGGGTSEGGGAIAFPIFTKLLHIAPRDARSFSLAIQSVGMGAASLSILYLRMVLVQNSASGWSRGR